MSSLKEKAWKERPIQPSWVNTSPRVLFEEGFDAGVLAERERIKCELAEYQGAYPDYIHDDFYRRLFPQEGESE